MRYKLTTHVNPISSGIRGLHFHRGLSQFLDENKRRTVHDILLQSEENEKASKSKMAATTKRKKVAKNSKQSWRKHSDINDVEEFLEELRREERTE